MDQVDSNTPVQQETVPESKTPTVVVRQGASGGLIAFLTILILALLGFVAYMFFTDKLDIGIDNPLSKQENVSEQENSDTEEQVENTEKTGKFSLTFNYPSEFTPPVRFCFSNTEDISEQHCFWQDRYDAEMSPLSNSDNYPNSYKWAEEKSLPVGTYFLDYTVYGSNANEENYPYQTFVYNDCLKALNGVNEYDGECKEVVDRWNDENFTQDSTDINLPELVGDPIEIKIEEGKTVSIKDIPLLPYFGVIQN